MPPVATLAKSRCSGHDKCAPTQAASAGQSILKVNGSPAMVIGGTFQTHGCNNKPHPDHTPIISAGSSILKINGVPVARIGDAVTGNICPGGHVIASGDSILNVE